MNERVPDCPLILAGAVAGKGGYTTCRRGMCAWWDLEHSVCGVIRWIKNTADKEEKR